MYADRDTICAVVFHDTLEDRHISNEIKVRTKNIYAYTSIGDIIKLPKGATLDFAYEIYTEIANTIVKAMVNDEEVQINHIIKNKDRVRVITDV